jgi:hypothetical protein
MIHGDRGGYDFFSRSEARILTISNHGMSQFFLISTSLHIVSFINCVHLAKCILYRLSKKCAKYARSVCTFRTPCLFLKEWGLWVPAETGFLATGTVLHCTAHVQYCLWHRLHEGSFFSSTRSVRCQNASSASQDFLLFSTLSYTRRCATQLPDGTLSGPPEVTFTQKRYAPRHDAMVSCAPPSGFPLIRSCRPSGFHPAQPQGFDRPAVRVSPAPLPGFPLPCLQGFNTHPPPPDLRVSPAPLSGFHLPHFQGFTRPDLRVSYPPRRQGFAPPAFRVSAAPPSGLPTHPQPLRP